MDLGQYEHPAKSGGRLSEALSDLYSYVCGIHYFDFIFRYFIINLNQSLTETTPTFR
jgi:hypothetical protein